MEYLIKRILSSKLTLSIVIVVLFIGGSLGAHLLMRYDKIVSQQNILYQDRIEFEKEKSKTSLKAATKEYQLKRLEESLKYREQLLASEEKEINVKEVNAKNILNSYNKSVSQYENNTQQNKETILLKAMDEFIAFGVDLNKDFSCSLTDKKKSLFNKAQAKYIQIYAIAEANNLKEKYKHFFFKHDQSMVHICPS